MVDAPRTVSILGATGSIGASTLQVIADMPGTFAVEAVTAGSNVAELARIARAVGARQAVVADAARYRDLQAALAGSGIGAAAGHDAIVEAASRPADIVVAAIVGAAGLAPTAAALAAGNHVALANKECLVCAGDFFMAAARRAGRRVLPVDSEHNALFQALEPHNIDRVERLILTASGGPFRLWSRTQLAGATPEAALRHPNWSMGRKVTVDSATLMNKGLELIEAHHLFGVESGRLDVVVHPQSVVHSMVAYTDGSTLAQISIHDMRVPIAYCLSWPERAQLPDCRLDLTEIGQLTFEKPDTERFPALAIARRALDAGGWATNILNAANEVAVEAFLAGAIGYLEIAEIVEQAIEHADKSRLTTVPGSVEEALALDATGRRFVEERIGRNRSAMVAGRN